MKIEHWRITALEFFLTAIFLVFEFYFGWPYSHVFTWILATFTIAGALVIILPFVLGLGGAIVILVLGLLTMHFLPPNETEFHGWLTPGNEPSPPTSCPFGRQKGWRVYAGENGVFVMSFNFNKLPILAIHGKPRLWVEKTLDGVAISGDVFDQNGTIVRLDKNEFTRSGANSFRCDRPNRHVLTVYDRFDNPVLTLKYLNPEAIYLTGKFWYPEQGTVVPILEITDHIFRCDGAKAIGQCGENIASICVIQGP